MVLPAPPAAEGQAAQAWLTRIRGLLTLGRAGTMIIVRYGQPWSPWPVQELITAMGERGELLLDARRILDVAPDAIVVLLARRIDLDWLNVNRPHFAGRRVLVWVPGDAWMEYRQRAPDFFDWASHAVEAPPILPRFVAEGFEVARGWWPGIVWLGGAPLELILRLLADEGRWPMEGGREVAWVDASGSIEELAEQFERYRGKVILVRGIDAFPTLWRVRSAMNFGESEAWVILDSPSVRATGWFPLHARQSLPDSGPLDRMSEGEPEAVEWQGRSVMDISLLSDEAQIHKIALLMEPGPILRAFHQHPLVTVYRDHMWDVMNIETVSDLDNVPLIDWRMMTSRDAKHLPGASAELCSMFVSIAQNASLEVVTNMLLMMTRTVIYDDLVRLAQLVVAHRDGPAIALSFECAPHTHAAAVERAMLHLHVAQIDEAMDILRPYLDEIRDPPRAQQLWILALRMQGRTLEANDHIDRWTARGLDPALFELRTTEHGTPREWLEHTMASDFDAVLAAALAKE